MSSGARFLCLTALEKKQKNGQEMKERMRAYGRSVRRFLLGKSMTKVGEVL